MKNFIEPTDIHHALSSYFKPDFSEVGAFYILDSDKDTADMSSDAKLQVDILIDNVIIPYQEFSRVDQHIGDTFSVHYFGKSPLVINCSGMLVDTVSNYNKDFLMDLYVNHLRLKAVARSGVMPILQLPGMSFSGALLNLSAIESSETIDRLVVTFSMLVFKLVSFSSENEGTKENVIDFTKNYFAKETSSKIGATTGAASATNFGSVISTGKINELRNSFIGPLSESVGSVVSEIVAAKMSLDFGNITNPSAMPEERMFNGLTGFMGYDTNEALALSSKYTNKGSLSSIENAIINDAIISKQMSPYANSLTGGGGGVSFGPGDILGTLRGGGLVDSVTNTSMGYVKGIANYIGGPLGGIIADSTPALKNVVKSAITESIQKIPGVEQAFEFMDKASSYLDMVDSYFQAIVNLPSQGVRELNNLLREKGYDLVDKLPDGIGKQIARSAMSTGIGQATSAVNEYYRYQVGGTLRDINTVRKDFKYWYKDVLRTPNSRANTEAAVERYKNRVTSSATNRATNIATGYAREGVEKAKKAIINAKPKTKVVTNKKSIPRAL